MDTPIFDRILLKIPKQQVSKEKRQQGKKRQDDIIKQILQIGREIIKNQPYHEQSFGNLRSLQGTLPPNEFSFNETVDRSSIVTQTDCFFQDQVMSTRTVLKQTARHNMTMQSQTTQQEGNKKKYHQKKKLSPSRYTRLYDQAMNKMKKSKDLPKEMLDQVKSSSRQKTILNKTDIIENLLKSNSAQRTQQASRATIHRLHNSVQRQSLYQRALKQKQKHEQLIHQQKNENLTKQLSGLTFKPNINKTVKVQGPFEERMAKAQKKASIHRAKIMKQQLQKHKQINMNYASKWKTAESKVKTVWSKPTTFYEQYYDAAYNH